MIKSISYVCTNYRCGKISNYKFVNPLQRMVTTCRHCHKRTLHHVWKKYPITRPIDR